MFSLAVVANRISRTHIAFAAMVIAVAAGFFSVANSQTDSSATLRGTVRDSQGTPVVGATVSLQAQSETHSLTTPTDLKGGYAFTGLQSGIYLLHVVVAGHLVLAVPSLSLSASESRNLDLSLPAPKPPSTQAGPVVPQFYDQPQFTVSGVTDTTSFGGHGSDTVVRTRETLAKETASLGKGPAGTPPEIASAAEKKLRETVERTPDSFEANHQLGKALLRDGRPRDGIPYFEHAAKLKPDDYENEYNLALAQAETGSYESALQTAQHLLVHNNKAELHHLLADVQEKRGDPLQAVSEYQRAADLDPNEAYLFDWGAELLLHHAPEPAQEVFAKGNRLFPNSERMLLGLGASWFARGLYDQAVERICEASDIDPRDPTPYIFLGKIDHSGSTPWPAILERLRRFSELHPESAEASYYYAASLWKRRKNIQNAAEMEKVESLLNDAVRLDPMFAAAYLQLGIFHSGQRNFLKAITEYQQATRLAPQMEEAHYRLAQAYRDVGETEKAKAEIQIYDQLSRQSAETAERQRHEIRQFVYTLRDQSSPQRP